MDIFADAFDAPLITGLDKTITQLEGTLKTMRGGDVNAELFDACAVEAYGDRQPLATVAHVAVASPTLVRISCFDPQLAPAVAKAVADIEGLGLNPNVSGGDVVVPIPRPSKEQRSALAKAAGAAAEEAKKRARNHRRDAHDRLKKASGGVSEDDVRAKKSAIDGPVDERLRKLRNWPTRRRGPSRRARTNAAVITHGSARTSGSAPGGRELSGHEVGGIVPVEPRVDVDWHQVHLVADVEEFRPLAELAVAGLRRSRLVVAEPSHGRAVAYCVQPNARRRSSRAGAEGPRPEVAVVVGPVVVQSQWPDRRRLQARRRAPLGALLGPCRTRLALCQRPRRAHAQIARLAAPLVARVVRAAAPRRRRAARRRQRVMQASAAARARFRRRISMHPRQQSTKTAGRASELYAAARC